jgi:hypothetical protein
MYHDNKIAARLVLWLPWFRFELHMIDLTGFLCRFFGPAGIDFQEIAPMLGAANCVHASRVRHIFAL